MYPTSSARSDSGINRSASFRKRAVSTTDRWARHKSNYTRIAYTGQGLEGEGWVGARGFEHPAS